MVRVPEIAYTEDEKEIARVIRAEMREVTDVCFPDEVVRETSYRTAREVMLVILRQQEKGK